MRRYKMVKIKLHTYAHLRSNGILKDLVQEDKTVQHTDYILYSPEIIDTLTNSNELVDIHQYNPHGDKIAFGIKKPNGVTTYIHPSWVYSIDSTVTMLTDVKQWGDGRKNLYKINDMYVLHKASGLTLLSTYPSCECGSTNIHYEDSNGMLCKECYDKAVKVENYSWKPAPNFIGEQITADKDNPVWYGIELEYGFNSKADYRKLRIENRKELYAKDDSSIRGGEFKTEIVTHPMSYKYLMSNKSFISGLDAISIEENPRNNGCHIHISRTAFVDEKHYSKWYFLMHELKIINEFVGGRELTDYCRFTPSGKVHSKTNKKLNGDRSVMINENNEHTVECRFFASTGSSESLRGYIQYIESIIKYTRYAGDTVTTKGWRAYTTRKHKKYANIIKLLEGCPEVDNSVTYRMPIVSKTDFKSMTVLQLHSISAIEYKRGRGGETQTVKVDSFRHLTVDNLSFYGEHGADSVDLARIISITIEE